MAVADSVPVVSSLAASGTQGSGLWTLSSLTPYFQARITDPLSRSSFLTYELEHDPSVPAQGSGLISSGSGTSPAASGSSTQVSVPSGKLTDGWMVRWRVRGVTTTGVNGPWSDWQLAKVDVSKPAVSELSASGTQASGAWTLTLLTPDFQAKITDPVNSRNSYLGAEVEHDPSVPRQGSGLIWSGRGTTATSGSNPYALVTVPSGKLTDGWLVRWRVRAVTTTGVNGPWSDWQLAKVDADKPTVSELSASGTQGSGLWTLSSLTPNFQAKVTDPVGMPPFFFRESFLGAEVEHDPSVPGQGSGLIWSGTGTTATSGSNRSASVSVPSGKLTDGWVVRWRVRAVTTTGVNGPWSDWQSAKVDIDKPAVSELSASGTQGSGLWTLSSLTPKFQAKVTDPAGMPPIFYRESFLGAEVEHDPSVPGQGSGLIWSGTGTTATSGSNRSASVSVPSGKLTDGWVVRWRVRAVTTTGVNGPWSDWQSAKVDIDKPAVSELSASGTQGSGLWTLSSLTPKFQAKVTDPAFFRESFLGAEVEHDPSVPGQGSGLIWSATGTTATSGSSNRYASVSVPSGKLTDGWVVRWRVRAVTTTGVNGPWSDWQIAKIDVNKPAGTGLGVVPGTKTGTTSWVLASATPWLYTKVTDAGGLASYLSAEIEHDPSAPGQGSGLIWSGTATKSYASASNAWVQVPPGKLTDGWLVRWRVRGINTSGTSGPWSDWQTATVDINKPATAAAGIAPGTPGPAAWTTGSLTPSLFAKVTDPQGRSSYLGVEVEHDPDAPEQGSGQIYAGTGTTAYASETNAWADIPSGKLSEGWRIRWRVRGVTTDGVQGPWSVWQLATVSALPFQTFSPGDNTQVGTLQPTLSAYAQSPSGTKVVYWFQLCSGTKDHWTWCESSPEWTKDGTFTPERKLTWGKTYWWYAKAATSAITVTSSWRTFTTAPEQGSLNALLGAGTDGREFGHVGGNYTTSVTDVSVAAVGLPLSVNRTYNSLDPRTDGAFGAGWSTRWDMRIVDEPATATALVTYPDGSEQRFASRGDGSYAAPQGMFATLVAVTGGGWRLMDKSSTSYWFDPTGRLTKISDRRGRVQELTFGTDGKLSKVTATGGRSLSFNWNGNHVASVNTDPVGGTSITWTYSYQGDKLVKVCPPASNGACTVYEYGDASKYRSVVLNSAPVGYWRLNETTTALNSKIVSSVGATLGEGDAKLAGDKADVTVGVSGALAGSPDTAMTFAGTSGSAYVSLPDAMISGRGGDLAVEAWFKTTGSGTVLGYQSSSDSASFPPGSYVPAIYVGTDGKLRGQFWTGTVAPITSSGVVNDGAWHHVVLAGATTTQTLFLDGQVVGTLAGKITHSGSDSMFDARIGYGFGSFGWPAMGNLFTTFPFKGSIDEVAVYDSPLGLAAVRTHYAARLAQSVLTKETQPSGRIHAENTYVADGGRVKTYTDANGGTWTLSDLIYAKESTTQTHATVTVTDPHNGKLTYVTDALRGYRDVSTTDQLDKTTTIAYDTGGFAAKITDPNGNATELSYNARGNLIAKKLCRSSDACSTEYYSYYLNVDEPFNPRNDQVTTFRDARSASATDDTYAVVMTYNAFGEPTKKTVPATADFPDGRSQVTAYTDGTEPAIGGGNTPAGLVKSQKDFKGNETTYAYTVAGDLAQETSPTGLVKKYSYDAIGRMTSSTEVSTANPGGVTTTISYDPQGRRVAVTNSAVKNEVTGVTHTLRQSITYDADGNPLTTSLSDLTGGDPERKTTYTYDSYGRADSVTGPEGGVERFGYDHKGQKVSYTDARDSVYNYAYTARGGLATITLKGWTGSPVNPQAATDVVMASYAYDPAGRMASQTDVMGRTTSYTYYKDDLAAETIASGARLNGASTGRDVVLDSKVYDPAGHITRQTIDGGTLRVDATYDAAGRLTSQTADPAKLARTSSYAYDANDNVTKITQTAAGTDRAEITEYVYDAADQPIRQAVRNNGPDLVTTLTVDERGLVTAVTDPRGNASGATASDYTIDLRYDSTGKPVEVKLPQVKVERNGGAPVLERPTTRLGYNTFGGQTHVVDAEGRKTTTSFDRAGRVIWQARPAYTPPGGTQIVPTVTAVYDAVGQQISSTDARGHTTTAVYDGLGRKVQVINPSVGGAAAGTTTYTYDLIGEALSQTDPTGAHWEATYDDLGRQISTTTFERKPTAAAYVTKLEYDDAGNLTKAIRPTGDATTRAYNALGELTSHTDASQNATSFDYDLSGRVIKTTNPLGASTTTSFDLAGRQIGTADVDASGNVLRTSSFGYDAAGNPISQTSATGHTTTRVFDAVNRLIEQREPVSASETITTSFGYDAAGQETRSTDGRGNSTYTTYNSLGLVESMIEPSTAAHPNLSDRTWTSVYDAAGNPVTSLYPGGVRVERVFDELNLLVKQTGSGAEVATKDKTFSYDLAGHLTGAGDLTFILNDRGHLLKSTGLGGDISAYAYDANNRLVQRIDATGTTSFTWDSDDRLAQMVDPVTSAIVGYIYDQASRLTAMTYGSNGARRTFAYDPLNRLTKDELKTSQDSLIASVAYGYDQEDNMISKATSGTAGAGSNTYTYDWASRLTSWTAPDGKTTEYGWDAAGNRIRAGDETFDYDERNRLTSGDGYTYTYTPRGTLAESSNGRVQITKFDAFDRLIQDGTATYDYDALDRMATRTESGQTTKFAYDGQTNNLTSVTDANNVTKASYGRDAFGSTVSLSDRGLAQLAFSDLHGDLIGTFTTGGTELADSTAYNPFGEVIAQSGATHDLGYQGGYTDPTTKKVNMAARWYQPATGSFTSRDSLAQSATPSVQLNRYTYANDNPLTNTDPTGHKAVKVPPRPKVKKVTTSKEYNTCKKNKFQGPNCKEEYKLYQDINSFKSACNTGYAYDTTSTACDKAVQAYQTCRIAGKKTAIDCEAAAITVACIKRLVGEVDCHDAEVVYKSCRTRTVAGKGAPAAICVEGNAEYARCAEDYTRGTRDVCVGAVASYEDCRNTGVGAQKCEVVRDVYAQCNYTGVSNVGGRRGYGMGAGVCQEVASDTTRCFLDKSIKGSKGDCFSAGIIQLECLKFADGNQKECGKLADAIYWCLGHAESKYCGDEPQYKCNKSKTQCTYYYSAVQAWFIKKLDKDAVDFTSLCSYTTAVSINPKWENQMDRASGICGLVTAGLTLLVNSEKGALNKEWNDTRKRYPGSDVTIQIVYGLGRPKYFIFPVTDFK
ncbi:RHS repeat-associated core domain-containing protein [Microtetraspora fusca]|uniref:RHS repeat-associated core domain-containing protein n=1 Tax=Microtetraspora fusca TaxID=1997 RepID=A0ABW6VJL5_MICFU